MKFVTVFKAVTKNWLRSRSGLFFSLMFPILLLLVFGAIFGGIGGGSTRYGLYVQNLDCSSDGQPTEVSDAFIQALNSTQTFSMTHIPAAANATDYVRDLLGPMGGTMRILVISDGFQDDLINGTLKVRLGIIQSTLNMTYQYFVQYLNSTELAALQD